MVIVEVIRKIAKVDLPIMLEIWNQHHKVLTSKERIHTIETLTEWYDGRIKINHDYFGLYINNQLTAFCITKNLENELWIKMLAVSQEGQQHGYGTKLVQYLIRDHRLKAVFAEVKIYNFSAINFFFKNNFKITKFDEEWNVFILIHNLITK